MKKLLRHLSPCGQSAGRGWPLLLALALSALWAAPAQAEYYALRICGVQVTDENKDKLSSSILGVKSGTVTYNPATKTLRLKDARLETGDQCIENAGVDGLTVEVEGTCRMTSDYRNGILLDASTTITGVEGTAAPSLVISASSAGVWARNGASCTISGLDLTATGKNFGLIGNSRESLTITDATVRATGASGSICDFLQVQLLGYFVLTPEDAAFDGGTLKKDGEVVTGEAFIGKNYLLRICGVDVTDANKDDLSVIAGVKSGVISYNPSSKTLRLKDAVVVTDGSFFSNLRVDGLTIEVEGTCRMETGGYNSIHITAPTTITGKPGTVAPSLAVSSSYVGIYVDDGACTIRDLDLTATGTRFGILGFREVSLTIENATVRATGRDGCIYYFVSVTLKDCQVATPAGAAFDGGTLKKDGEVVAGEALILPDAAMGIGTTAGDAPRREGVYTLSGVRLAAPLDQLPRGVYVVDGRKVVKK